jgi:hypothetical protein
MSRSRLEEEEGIVCERDICLVLSHNIGNSHLVMQGRMYESVAPLSPISGSGTLSPCSFLEADVNHAKEQKKEWVEYIQKSGPSLAKLTGMADSGLNNPQSGLQAGRGRTLVLFGDRIVDGPHRVLGAADKLLANLDGIFDSRIWCDVTIRGSHQAVSGSC